MIIDRAEFDLLLEECIAELSDWMDRNDGRGDPHFESILRQLEAARDMTANGALIDRGAAERFSFGIQASRTLSGEAPELTTRIMNVSAYLRNHLVGASAGAAP